MAITKKQALSETSWLRDEELFMKISASMERYAMTRRQYPHKKDEYEILAFKVRELRYKQKANYAQISNELNVSCSFISSVLNDPDNEYLPDIECLLPEAIARFQNMQKKLDDIASTGFHSKSRNLFLRLKRAKKRLETHKERQDDREFLQVYANVGIFPRQ